jgi:hypothetical protein
VERLVKLVFNVDHDNYSANEGAAFDLNTAARLVATGVCRIADDEPSKEELEAASNAYRAPKPGRYWEIGLVSRFGRELIAAFGLRNK